MIHDFYIHWIVRFISFAVLLQSIEMLCLRKAWADNGIWSLDALKDYYERKPILSKFAGLALKERNFLIILVLQIVLSAANILWINPWITLVLFILSLLQILRWRGYFNGGSDSMTLILLLSSSVLLIFNENETLKNGILLYVALQAVLSYFVAGTVKAKNKQWWSGKALQQILTLSQYPVPTWAKSLIQTQGFALVFSVLIIAFELLFPLALIGPAFANIFVLFAILFHVMNGMILGLNRFIFAWLAAYPAIYFLATNY